MSLVAVALALTITQDPGAPGPTQGTPAPLPLFEAGMIGDDGQYTSLLQIGSDGRWVGSSDQSGQLAPNELAQIQAAAKAVVLTTTPAEKCTRTERTTLQMVRVPRGEVRFAPVCGPKADRSVEALLALADSFTVARPNPMVVQYDHWGPGKEELKTSVRLMRDGLWSTDKGVGSTGGPEFDALVKAFAEADISVSPASAPGCAITHVYDLDVPGRGKLRWFAPCQTPSQTLGAALDKLVQLVSQRPADAPQPMVP